MNIMASEKYAMTDQDAVNALSDEALVNQLQQSGIRANSTRLSEEEKKSAKRDVRYYTAVNIQNSSLY